VDQDRLGVADVLDERLGATSGLPHPLELPFLPERHLVGPDVEGVEDRVGVRPCLEAVDGHVVRDVEIVENLELHTIDVRPGVASINVTSATSCGLRGRGGAAWA
jgi:hypothetical protein